MKEELNFISKNLKSYRARMGYSQDDMAKYLGVSRTTYCNYEVNPKRIKIDTYNKIADILHCDIKDFFVKFNDTESDIQ